MPWRSVRDAMPGSLGRPSGLLQRHGTCRLVRWLCPACLGWLAGVAMCAGCSQQPPAELRLVVISPHRDEIRSESALAFSDWYMERSRLLVSTAEAQLDAWMHGQQVALKDIDQTLADWQRLWDEEHIAPVLPILQRWQLERDRLTGGDLLQLLRDWKKRWEHGRVFVEWRDIGGGTSQILRYLEARYRTSPDGVGIDLLFGGGTDIYLDLKEKGMLNPWHPGAQVAAQLRQHWRGVSLHDPDGYWYGIMLSSLGLFVNREVAERLGLTHLSFDSWRDLARPELYGWVTAGDPRMSGSVRMLYEVILQRYGWEQGFEILMRMGANARGFGRFSDAVTKDVVFGRALVGGSLDSYAFSAMTREQEAIERGLIARRSLDFVLPPGETILNPDSAGMLRGAPHPRLAGAFLEFLLSEQGGQRLWLLKPRSLPGSPRRYAICRLSIVPTLYDDQRYEPTLRTSPVNPFAHSASAEIFHYDNGLAERRRHVVMDLFGVWVIDEHSLLRAAWGAIVEREGVGADTSPLARDLFRVPIAAHEIPGVTERLRAGPRSRAELLEHWRRQARQRYTSILNRVRAARQMVPEGAAQG